MKLLKAEAGVNDGKAGLLSAAGLFAKGGIFDKKSESFNIQELDPYLLFDARSSMLGTLENPTLDLDPATPSTLDVITATRSSVATRTLPDGTIALAEQDTVRVDYTQGAELTPTKFQRIENTDFSQDWTLEGSTLTESQTTAPDGTTPVYELTENTSTSRHRLFVSGISLVVGQDYTVSAYVKKVSSGRFFLINSSALNGIKGFLNLDTGVATLTGGTGTIAVTNEGGDWYRLSVTAQATTTNGFVYMQLQNAQTDVNYTGTGASMLIWGPQLEEGTTASSFVANTTGSPKFTGISATYAARVPMILCEPSATNLLPYSEDFSNSAWTKFGAGTGVAPTATPNYGTSPDGTVSASRIQFDKGSGTGYTNMSVVHDSVSTSSGATTAKSVYLKSNTTEAYEMVIYEVTSASGTNVKKITVTPDWQRFDVYGAISSTTTGIAIGLREINVSGLSNTADVLVWGAQVETGSVATSIIPTSGGDAAARTRAADNLVISGSDFSDFYNASEGTFYAEVIDRTPTIQSAYLFGQAVGQYYLYSNSGASVVDSFDGVNYQGVSGVVANQLFRAAATFDSSTKSISVNGTTSASGAHNGDWGAANKLRIGNGYGTLNGYVKRVIFWPTHSSRL